MTAPIPPARIAEFRSWIEHWRGGGPSLDEIARGLEELLDEREMLRGLLGEYGPSVKNDMTLPKLARKSFAARIRAALGDEP